MDIRELNGKRICILGFGREGQAILHALEQHAPDADITIADKNPEIQDANRKMQTGEKYMHNLDDFDTVIKSPGIPPCPELEIIKNKMTTSTQIFLDSITQSSAVVIGVTGSKGKSTTASLIAEMMKSVGTDVHLVGNIGNPAIAAIGKARKETIFVLEMSSYQLMNLTVSPHIAVITSFFPEHLDYHGSVENYLQAKKHITQFQKPEDLVFFNAASDHTREIATASAGKKIAITADGSPLPLHQTKLIGTHNLMNIALAAAVAKHLGTSEEAILQAIKNFTPLPHRLQRCGEHHDIEWVDDSISTTPESAIAALEALEGKVKTLILGGQDRGLDFSALGKTVAKAHVDTVILLGESAPRIRKALEDANALVDFYEADSMEDAVEIARTRTPKFHVLKSQTPICLLSPAAPSYDMFKNFEERGDAFQNSLLIRDT